jgi:hypothetical protein
MLYPFTAKHLGKSEEMKDKMGWECGMHGKKTNVCRDNFMGNLKEGDNLAGIGIYGSNIELGLDMHALVNMFMNIQVL